MDTVMLTAHGKFNNILAEAQKGDSIFKAGNVIKVEDIPLEEVTYTQLSLDMEPESTLQQAYEPTELGRP